MSNLHATLHEQIEEVHIRCDEHRRRIDELTNMEQQSASRAQPLGVVTSSCLASIRALSDRVRDLDKMRFELQSIARQADAILLRTQHQPPDHCAQSDKTPETEKNSSQRATGTSLRSAALRKNSKISQLGDQRSRVGPQHVFPPTTTPTSVTFRPSSRSQPRPTCWPPTRRSTFSLFFRLGRTSSSSGPPW